MKRRSVQAASLVTVALGLGSARADETGSGDAPVADPRPPNAPYTDPAHPHVLDPHDARRSPLEPTPMTADPMRHWQLNPARPFLQATIDLGFPYLRPTVAAGYGRPHYMWAGIETTPQISGNFGALYVGLRATLPWLEVRTGVRRVRPLFHSQLPIKGHYDVRDLDRDRADIEPYTTYEVELLPEVRLGPGFALGAFTLLGLRGFSHTRYIYEENLRVIAALPVLVRARAGYLFDVKPLARARIGGAVEVIEIPGRNERVVRAGVLGLWRLHEQVDVLVQLLPVMSSPDGLGLVGADFNQLGVRFRWATPDIPGPKEE
jgi:hypothetical protein